MELNINEFDYDDNIYNYNQDHSFEQIPENTVPVKVIKQGSKPMIQSIPKVNAKIIRPKIPEQKQQISYDDILAKMGMFVSNGKLHLLDDKTPQQKEQIKKQILTSKQSYTQQPSQSYNQQPSQTYNQQPSQSYTQQPSQSYNQQPNQSNNQQPSQSYNQQPSQSYNQQPSQSNIPANSYIYNKYFKEELQHPDVIRQPMSISEYRHMMLTDILQRQRIKQIKSTKLSMPTSNINISGGNTANLNKLFNFSKR